MNYDLVAKQLNVNEVNGIIRITDTSYADNNILAKVKEYTRGNVKTWNLTKTNTDFNGENATVGDFTDSYKPQSGLTYNWTNGYTSSRVEYFDHEFVTGGWRFEWSSDEINHNLDKYSTNPILVTNGEQTDRKNGEYIGNVPSGITLGDNSFVVKRTSTNISDNDPQYVLDYESKWDSGFLGYYHHYYKKWHTITGSLDTYEAALKADNDIKIKFIGQAPEDGTISINSVKNIELDGNIGNKQLYKTEAQAATNTTPAIPATLTEKGTVNVTSTGGSIVHTGGDITAANVNLTATGNIENVNILAGDTVTLNATTIVPTNDSSTENMPENVPATISVEINSNKGALANVVTGDIGGANTEYFALNVHGGENGGNISQVASTEPMIQTVADRIDLITDTGSIYGQKIVNTEDNTSVTYTNYKLYGGQFANGIDSLSASVNA
mgnify:CR=1 FL=1